MKRLAIYTLLNSKQYGYCARRNEPTITRYSHNSFAKNYQYFWQKNELFYIKFEQLG